MVWTRERFVKHPAGPAVSTTTEIPGGTVSLNSRNDLIINHDGVLSHDTSFKYLRRAIQSGRINDFSEKQKRLLASWDYGTNFTVEHMTREPAAAHLTASRDRIFSGKGTRHEFSGPWFCGVSNDVMSQLLRSNVLWPSLGESENMELFALGGTAISRTLPTRSTSQLGVALIELLKEGVPSAIGSQLRVNGLNTRSVAGEYLNVQFGWAPVIREVISVLDTVRRSSEILEEYHRLQGEHIRRRYEFPEVSTTDEFTGPNLWTGSTSDSYIYNGTITTRPHVVRTMKTKSWFSGAYRYYLPYGDDLLSKIRLWEAEANRLMGLRLTPELLWNVSPWTWLSDWFVSIGDVITNISHIGQDGLTLHYGYIMRTTTLEAEVRLPNVRLRGSSVDVSERVTLQRKVRRRASPFGFGITPDMLTSQQWSILAALGASRAPGVGFNNINP